MSAQAAGRVLIMLSLCALAARAEAPGGAVAPGAPAPRGELLFEEKLPVEIVRVGPAEGWTPALIDALRAGLATLPAGALRFPGGRLEVELHPEPAPFGMGDGTEARPDWTDGHRRFHLYAFAEPGDPRAAFRLTRLTPAQREVLWRRRAMVHAVVRRWDEALRWSRRDGWKRITGWQGSFDKPLTLKETPTNRYAWAYSRARGMDSASLDLATFAEEALVPADAFVADPVPVDDALPCQEFSKLRFLRDRLEALGAAPVPPARCPAFQRWSDLPGLDHLEVLFSAPSGEHPESLFGHVLLRLVRKPNGRARGPGFEQVVEIAALTGVSNQPQLYIWRGMTGHFQTIFGVTSFAHVLKQNIEIDQRNLRRYRLELTEGETARLMERIWEAERRAYLGYYFLTDNCASQLLWLLNGALEEGKQIEIPGTLWVMPTATLDAMAELRITERSATGAVTERSLLRYLPGDILSHQTLALAGERRRAGLRETLRLRLPAEVHADWSALLDAAERTEPRQRAVGYRRLAALVERTLHLDDGATVRAWIYTFLRSTDAIERYSADRASAAQSNLRAATVVYPPDLHLPTAEELVAERQREFEHEDVEARAQVDLERVLRLSSATEGAPHRAYSPSEQVKADLYQAMTDTFAAWTSAEGDVIDRHFADLDTAPTVLRLVEQAEALERAPKELRASGYGSFGFEAGVGDVAGTWGPLIRSRSALLAERLGDQRQRGFGPQTELHLLDTELTFRAKLDLPELVRLDLKTITFRTLGREPLTLRTSPTSWLGWGMGLEVFRDKLPTLDQRGRASAQLYAVLDATPRYERFVAVGLGAALDVDFEYYPKGAAIGPKLELLGRLPVPGHTANALRLEAQYVGQFKALGDGGQRWIHRADLSTQLELFVGNGGERGAVIAPRLTARWKQDGALASQELIVSFGAQWL